MKSVPLTARAVKVEQTKVNKQGSNLVGCATKSNSTLLLARALRFAVELPDELLEAKMIFMGAMKNEKPHAK